MTKRHWAIGTFVLCGLLIAFLLVAKSIRLAGTVTEVDGFRRTDYGILPYRGLVYGFVDRCSDPNIHVSEDFSDALRRLKLRLPVSFHFAPEKVTRERLAGKVVYIADGFYSGSPKNAIDSVARQLSAIHRVTRTTSDLVSGWSSDRKSRVFFMTSDPRRRRSAFVSLAISP